MKIGLLIPKLLELQQALFKALYQQNQKKLRQAERTLVRAATPAIRSTATCSFQV
jgi:hypothetical protein